MSWAVIVGIIFAYACFASWAKKKEKVAKFYKENTGSRDVEIEEWEKWSRRLFEENNQLKGIALSFPIKIKMQYCFERPLLSKAYKGVLGADPLACNDNGYDYKLLRDADVIEILRVKYNLPSNAEFTAKYGRPIYGESHYNCVGDIAYQCVLRAVHAHGLKYGGREYGKKRVDLSSKYPWL